MFVDTTSNPERNRSLEQKTAFLSGGGGLVSSMDDYSKFCNMLLNYGTYTDASTGRAVQVLKKESVVAMSTNHLEARDGVNTDELIHYAYDNSFSETIGESVGFGYGVSVVTRYSL